MEGITRAYLESLTPMKRRTFISGLLSGLLISGNLEGLVAFFRKDEVLGERLRDKGPDFVIQDFLRAYPLYCEEDHPLAKQLLQSFLGFLVKYQEQVNIKDVVTWLQSVNDNRLLVDACGLAVTSAQWRPPDADPRKCKRLEMILRRSLASHWRRRERRYADAWDEFTTLMKEWESFEPAEREEPSILEYERGYILFLQGKSKEAADLLFHAAALAQEAGDSAGTIINRFFGYLFQRHGGLLPLGEVKARMKSLRAELEKHPRGPRVDGMLLNMAAHIFQVACAMGDGEEARVYAELALRGQMMRRMKDDLGHRRIEHLIEGQLALVRGKWREALCNFAAFLDADLVEWGSQDPDLVALEKKTEEAALGYRDAGVALRALGNIALARKVWERGLDNLRCPDEALNIYCKREIRQLLKETETAIEQ